MGKCSVYDGKIAKVRGKDSYDIDFDDGDKKKAVPLQNIKAVNVDDICETSIDVLEHRGTNKNIDIEIKYVEEVGVPSWTLLSKIRKGLYTEDIAEYAIQNSLLETPGWEWAKKVCSMHIFFQSCNTLTTTCCKYSSIVAMLKLSRSEYFQKERKFCCYCPL